MALNLPTKIVEVAFTGGDASPSWTDITQWVQSMSIKRGRNRETDQSTAGTLTLQLKNNDRRFDPEYSAGPYFGNLLPMVPVRVQATWNSITYDLFRGYADNWPQTYAIPRASFTKMTATDGLKVLNRLIVPTEYRRVVANDNPDSWFPLDDPSITNPIQNIGALKIPAGIAAPPAAESQQSIVAGDSGTSVSFNDDGGYIDASGAGPNSQTWSFECWFSTTGTTDTVSTIMNMNDIGGFVRVNVVVNGTNAPNGFLELYTTNSVGGFTSLNSPARVDDGLPHHVVVTSNATQWTLYLDGALVGTVAGTYGVPTTYWYTLFGATLNCATWAIGSWMKGNLQHIAIYRGVELNSTQVSAHYNAGIGYPGEYADTRIGRYLDEGGWPSALRTINTGHIRLGAAPLPTNASAPLSTNMLNMLQATAATDGGVLYMDTTGKVTFRSGWAMVSDSRSVTSQATFSDAANQLPYNDLQFSFDDTLLRNYVTGQRTGGTTQVAQDATSIAAYYTQGYQRPTTNELTDDDCLRGCEFVVSNYKDPVTRVEKMVVNGRATNGTVGANSVYAQLLGRAIGDRITVNRTPQATGSAISKNLIIEGIQHDATPDNWVTTFSVSPPWGESTAGVTGYLILNDTTRGKLDTNRLGV